MFFTTIVLGTAAFLLSATAGAKGMEESNKARQQNLYNQATSWKQTASKLEADAETFSQQAEDSYNQALIYQSNAGAKLEQGQQIYDAATEKEMIQKTQMGAALGNMETAVGRSSVEMGGSSERLLTDSARQMTRDLQALRNTTQREFSTTMAHREIDILSSWNLTARGQNYLESEQNYMDMAGDYRSDAAELEAEADKIDTNVNVFEYWGLA